MTRVSLLPRLKSAGVDVLLEEAGAHSRETRRALNLLDENSALVSFSPSGGAKDPDAAVRISQVIREVAENCGFPNQSSIEQRADFDRKAAIALAQCPELQSGEALRDDVWAYMTTVLAPDVVAWRFPKPASHRFAGGVRNTFQRLWMRGRVLDRGPENPERWHLLKSLSEDAMVQIFERASLSTNRHLAQAIAEEWVLTAEEIGRGPMESVMRRASKLVRLRNEIIDLAFLHKSNLAAEVKACFEQSVRAQTSPETPNVEQVPSERRPRRSLSNLFGMRNFG